MNNKKKFLFLGISLFGVTAIALPVALTSKGLVAFGSDGVWNHYTAVAAGLGKKGIKEYWVNCNDHNHQFTAPASGEIAEKGAPDQAFIDALASDDDRLIPAYERYYDFNDNNLPAFITPNYHVSGVQAANGRVEISVETNDYGVNIGKDYLDAAFADSSVQAIAFDAYSPDEATSNFRHRHNGSNVCYEKNEEQNTETGYGLVTGGYKTFFFTRSMYNEWTSGTYVDGNGDCVIWGGGSIGPKVVYIDNLRVASKNSTTRGYLDFENGAFNTGTRDYRLSSGAANFAPNGGSGEVPTFEYDIKSNGLRSVVIEKTTNQWASFTVNSGGDFFKNIPDEGFLVDVRATSTYNHSVGMRNGQSSDNLPWSSSTVNLSANTWYTYHIKKSYINTSGRFMQIGASTTATWYVDNLRYVTGTTYGFEGAYVRQNENYVTVAGYDFDVSESGKLRDQTQCYQMILNNNAGMVTYAGLDTEHVTEGAQALKLTFEHTGYNMISFEPYLIEALDSVDTISMDVYSDGATFAEGSLFEDVTPGQWTTITFAKSDLATNDAYSRLSSKAYRTQANIVHIGSVWFDNIRTENVD